MNDTKNMNGLFSKLMISVRSRFGKRDYKTWLFGEWFGNRCCDNSLYFANYIAENHPGIKLYWAANSGVDTSLLDKRVKVIDRNDESSINIYKKAGVIIMNQGIGDFTDVAADYFSGAITVNLWHGVPWKKILIDSIDKSKLTEYFIIKGGFLLTRAKYFLSLSDEFTKVLKTSGGLRTRNIIRAGYPRNSLFYDDLKVSQAREKIIELIAEKGGPQSDINKIIVYMPTFRDSGAETFSFNSMNSDFRDYLEENGIVLVEKKHYEDQTASDGEKSDRILNIPDCNAPELLAAADMLITDYSSCFFDYLVLDRPVIHYIYDYEYYSKDDRGLYYSKEDVLCGDAPETVDDLVMYIKENLDDPDKNKMLRDKVRNRFLKYEDSKSCERIYRFIVRKIKKRGLISKRNR